MPTDTIPNKQPDNTPSKEAQIHEALDALGADCFQFNTDITRATADKFIDLLMDTAERKPSIILYLTTCGGDPGAAYHIARVIQRHWSKFYVFVSGVCKSAGTLLALGASELIMDDYSELGPIEVQRARRDELVGFESVLNVRQAMTQLSAETFNTFEESMLAIVRRSQGSISTRTAAEIAANLAGALMAPIASQIDPVRLGEAYRDELIAIEYGTRLAPHLEQAVRLLVIKYPEHGFVIDCAEAKDLFSGGMPVRNPNDHEVLIQKLIGNTRYPISQPQKPLIKRIVGVAEAEADMEQLELDDTPIEVEGPQDGSKSDENDTKKDQ